VDVAFLLQHRAHRADAAVHHVARGDDVDAGLGLHARLADQHRHGGVVDDVARLVEQAVLAVRRERIERDVGHHAQVGEMLLQRAHGARDQAVGVERLGAIGRLQRRLDGREQRQRGHAERHAFLGHVQQPVDAQALHAGHALDVLRLVLAFDDEDREDQVAGAQAVFADQFAAEGIAAQPARATCRVGGQKGHGTRSLRAKTTFCGVNPKPVTVV